MDLPEGVKYLLVVSRRPEPSGRGITDCTEPLPKDFTPKTMARLLSCTAPARISLPDAVPSLIKTTIGQSMKWLVLVEWVIGFWDSRRPLVEQITLPWGRNVSVILRPTLSLRKTSSRKAR